MTVHNCRIGSGTQLDVAREAHGFVAEAASIEGFRAYYMIDAGQMAPAAEAAPARA